MNTYKGSRILVTGASGFLGSHAVRALISNGAEVHGLVRGSATLERLESLEGDLRIHRGDLLDYPSLAACIEAADPVIIMHLAGDVAARRSLGEWEDLRRSVDVNLVGTLNLVRAAAESNANIESMVRVGGLEEYGRAPVPFVEGAREEPVSAYSAAQVAATHFCQTLQPQLRFQLATVRPALVYGPLQGKSFFIPQLIEACIEGKDFDMTDGTQSRDLVYVDDVIDGILLAATARNLRGAVVNLASGKELTVASIADMIVRLTGAAISIHRGGRETSPAEIDHLVGSTALARSLLGWEAKTPLEEGLEHTIRSYASRS
jgi:nucleoside-diphosphate-sugar epimerase